MESKVFESSSIMSAEYNEQAEILFVTFKNGKRYQYSQVGPEVWTQMKQATSVGLFFNSSVVGKYSYIQI